MADERPILVTGVSGFIGSHTAHHLATSGATVIGLDAHPAADGSADLALFAAMALPDPGFASLLADARPRALIHCAGRASVSGSITDPGDDFRTNTVMTFETLDAVRAQVPDCHFLFPSSAAVYGDPLSLPIGEDAPLRPVSPYGFHKLAAETLCREFAVLHGMRTTVLRIFSAYGPGLRRQVLWDICLKALTEPEVVLHGTGAESRDFVWIGDIAAAFAFLIEHPPAESQRAFNLGTGVETRIDDLATALIDALDVNASVRFGGQHRPGDPLNWRADAGALDAIGFRATTPLSVGVGELAAWAKEDLLGA